MTEPEIANGLFHEWALPGLLAVFVIALVQVAYVVLSTKQRDVTAHYLRIREVLAGTFRRALFVEARAVFKEVEAHLLSSLIHRGSGEGERTRFDLLAEGLREADPEDPDALDYQRVVRDALGGVLIDGVDALLESAERRSDEADAPGGDRPGLNISFAESTVDDFVYLARALQLTRRYESRFLGGSLWARRFLYGLIPSFVVLVGSMLINAGWAYWVAVASLVLFGLTGFGSLAASSIALRARGWLEERAEAPDAGKLFRSEMES